MAERSPDPESARSSGPRDLEFFDGMAWPVPLSFAGAIAGMRFEQGDVLYREKKAYDELVGKIPPGLSAIQVLLPKRSQRGAAPDSTGDRRSTSWQSEVTVELIDMRSGDSESRVLTQGKLAMALFSGDEGWFDPVRGDPPVPLSARELQQALPESLAELDARTGRRSGSRFAFVVDLASDASRAKASSIQEALRANGSVDAFDLSPTDARLEQAGRFHPSLVIRALILPERTSDEALATLRDTLYGGSAAKEATSEGRFSIGRHGILQDLG